MADECVSLDPAELSQDAAYDILVAAVSPRPIALVSTISQDGIPNLAPFSFFMAGGANPLSLAFSPTHGSGGPKDTLSNILATKEFVVNTVHGDMAYGMNACSYAYGAGDAEWRASGFTRLKSELVGPPRVGESLVQMECKLFQVVHHGDGSGAANYVIGEIVKIHVRRSVWGPSGLQQTKVHLLARMGGPNYLDAQALQIFEMQRPNEPVPEER